MKPHGVQITIKELNGNKAVITLDYQPGTLEAVVYKDGQETGRDILVTADRTVERKLSAERYSIKADGRDLAFVTIQAVDENGHPVYIENRNLTVEVQGAAFRRRAESDLFRQKQQIQLMCQNQFPTIGL